MTTQETAKMLETNLKGKGYAYIGQALADTDSEVLLRLLDSRSIKVGDTAADMLSRKRACPLVISAILEERISTKFGKIRGQNILFRFGRGYPEALKASLALLNDRNDEVADNALLALVCWGDKRVIPFIKERKKVVKSGGDTVKSFELACEALEKSDPSIFSPYFADADGIWK